jgi:Fic family protein
MMLLNHRRAISYLLDHISEMEVNKREIFAIHSLLSNGLLRDPSNIGQVRDISVGITASTYRPLDVRWRLEEQLDPLISTASKIDDPFEKSFFLLANVAYLQVFVDVNKRTSRLVCHTPLLKNGFCPLSFFNMSREGYEKGIIHYYETGDPRRVAREYLKGYIVSFERFKEHTQSPQLDPEMSHLVFMGIRKSVLENALPDRIARAATIAKSCCLSDAVRVRYYYQ